MRYAAAASIWVPYGNGYFYDDAALGLVWVSQDPWGFITEHYGYWRHHAQLGYVWRPFAPLRWRPSQKGLRNSVFSTLPTLESGSASRNSRLRGTL